MTSPSAEGPRPGAPPARPPASGEASLTDLLGEMAVDLSRLVHDEIALAKAEVKQEASKAGKAAGMFGGAGYAGHLAVLLASLAAVFGLSHVIDLGWAALVIALVWAVVGAVLYVRGRQRMRTVQLTPERSIDSLKEDAKWARHPTS